MLPLLGMLVLRDAACGGDDEGEASDAVTSSSPSRRLGSNRYRHADADGRRGDDGHDGAVQPARRAAAGAHPRRLLCGAGAVAVSAHQPRGWNVGDGRRGVSTSSRAATSRSTHTSPKRPSTTKSPAAHPRDGSAGQIRASRTPSRGARPDLAPGPCPPSVLRRHRAARSSGGRSGPALLLRRSSGSARSAVPKASEKVGNCAIVSFRTAGDLGADREHAVWIHSPASGAIAQAPRSTSLRSTTTPRCPSGAAEGVRPRDRVGRSIVAVRRRSPLAGLGLGQPNRGDLGIGEDHARNGAVVGLRVLPEDVGDGDAGLVLGDVRERRHAVDVADRPDAFAGPAALVHLDAAPAGLDPDRVEAESRVRGRRPVATISWTPRASLPSSSSTTRSAPSTLTACAWTPRRRSMPSPSRISARASPICGDSRSASRVGALDDRHPRSEAGEELSELDADDAAADDHDALRDRRQVGGSRFVQ